MIVLEGPDNCGKTTLARQLSDLHGIPLSHSGGPVRSEDQMHERMAKLLAINESVIMDRIPCISEQIYGPIIRGVNIFEGTDYLKIFIDTHFPLIIYCDIPSVLLYHLKHKGKQHEDPKHIADVEIGLAAIQMAYGKLFSRLTSVSQNTFSIVHWDWSSRDSNHFNLLNNLISAYRIIRPILTQRSEPSDERT